MKPLIALKKHSNATLTLNVTTESLRATDSGNLVPIHHSVEISAFLKPKVGNHQELPGLNAAKIMVEGYLTDPLPDGVNLPGECPCKIGDKQGILEILPILNFLNIPTKITGNFKYG